MKFKKKIQRGFVSFNETFWSFIISACLKCCLSMKLWISDKEEEDEVVNYASLILIYKYQSVYLIYK